MRLRTRTAAVLFVAAAACTALVPRAVAAPMPWETSRVPGVTAPGPRPAADHGAAEATVLCAPPCYQ
ncbi:MULTISPECIES: hypothetical protein [unclassified Streptomyces]|uniref:hypothetical protein n=1 Tax=unclassified Streptomyces TaxID=2593676 RepID=UPI00342BE89C